MKIDHSCLFVQVQRPSPLSICPGPVTWRALDGCAWGGERWLALQLRRRLERPYPPLAPHPNPHAHSCGGNILRWAYAFVDREWEEGDLHALRSTRDPTYLSEVLLAADLTR